MEFHNKIVIITGASVEIGKAISIEFAGNGANYALLMSMPKALIHLPGKHINWSKCNIIYL